MCTLVFPFLTLLSLYSSEDMPTQRFELMHRCDMPLCTDSFVPFNLYFSNNCAETHHDHEVLCPPVVDSTHFNLAAWL